MPPTDSTQRFSDRVENYIRYRPSYPPQVIEALRSECGLTASSSVADIASGTGIFSRLLLENGNRVYGVEPNREMREAGERLLVNFRGFMSIAGTAEATTLPDQSVDFATAAQAAHWFDLPKARKEFARILTPQGWAVLIWNERCTDTTPFLREYEDLLLGYGTDYEKVRHENTTDNIGEFFAPTPFEQRVFDMRQDFDYAQLEGRLLSSSYAPMEGHPKYEPMLKELRRVFDAHEKNGSIGMDYLTRVYFGRLA
ncbi:MAG TPA: methyltransferase domain-containing protein [Terriglobales bacterium]|nr:methyltransferase domain-containing protein [Terriglobales bacterium]